MDHKRVLNFWFKENSSLWFTKDKKFDEKIKKEFVEFYHEVREGKYEEWEKDAASILAMIIVLDQFPRNMFRNDKKSFMSDAQALELSKRAIVQKFDEKLNIDMRAFLYLPLEHSENIRDQEESVKKFTELKHLETRGEMYLDYAIQHYKIIQRFGRFPHRNEILGRKSTDEEIEFLKEKGSSF